MTHPISYYINDARVCTEQAQALSQEMANLPPGSIDQLGIDQEHLLQLQNEIEDDMAEIQLISNQDHDQTSAQNSAAQAKANALNAAVQNQVQG